MTDEGFEEVELEEDDETFSMLEVKDVSCIDCRGDVQEIVSAHQVVGIQKVVCADCFVKRIHAKAAKAAEKFMNTVEKFRATRTQLLLSFPPVSTEEKPKDAKSKTRKAGTRGRRKAVDVGDPSGDSIATTA